MNSGRIEREEELLISLFEFPTGLDCETGLLNRRGRSSVSVPHQCLLVKVLAAIPNLAKRHWVLMYSKASFEMRVSSTGDFLPPS